MKIGTRKSRLALWQTEHVIRLLQEKWPFLQCDVHHFTTQGDTTLDKPLPAIGGKGLFTLELENGLRNGDIDIAVHSLKDLPVETPDDIVLGAIVGRADVRDVLISKHDLSLGRLPLGATVGTSSLRRQAQLLAARPDLNVKSVRGNVETRIHKALETDDYDAVVLAAAGVMRLGLDAKVSQMLPLDVMLPAPGQGALAVQCRTDDGETLRLLAAINRKDVRDAVAAERTFLHALSGGCATPVAAYAEPTDAGRLKLHVLVGSPDGADLIEFNMLGDDPIALGYAAANKALRRGAHKLLEVEKRPRVVVTRSAEQAAAFADALLAAELQPLLFPVIRFEPLPHAPLHAALDVLSAGDWLVFTSVNAVGFFQAAQGRVPTGVRIAAVGSATVQALAKAALAVDFVPDTFSGEALAAGLAVSAETRVVLPRAKIGRPEIVERLRARGATVHDVPLYDTVTNSVPDALRRELAIGYDVLTFTSPSSVRNFMQLNDHRVAEDALVACIGPSTAAEAATFGLRCDLMPEQYTVEALVDVVKEGVRSRQ